MEWTDIILERVLNLFVDRDTEDRDKYGDVAMDILQKSYKKHNNQGHTDDQKLYDAGRSELWFVFFCRCRLWGWRRSWGRCWRSWDYLTDGVSHSAMKR